LNEVIRSGQCAVVIDTKTDVSNLEQFTFILKYVNEEGFVQERLVSLVIASDVTGLGMLEVFYKITNKYNIEWNNMKEQYSSLKLEYKLKIHMLYIFDVVPIYLIQ